MKNNAVVDKANSDRSATQPSIASLNGHVDCVRLVIAQSAIITL